MPKVKTLFSYFSPKPVARRQDEEGRTEKDVLTPKKSPNDKKIVSTSKSAKPSASSPTQAKIGAVNGTQADTQGRPKL